MHGGIQAGRRERRKCSLLQDPLTARAGEMGIDNWVQRLDSGFGWATKERHARAEGREQRDARSYNSAAVGTVRVDTV